MSVSQTNILTYDDYTCLEEAAALLPATRAGVLLEQLEGALPRLVALAGQELQRLLAGQHLLAAHNAAVLVLDEVLLVQAAGRVLRRAVEHLGLGANRGDICHLIFGVAILSAGGWVAACKS